MPGQQGETKFGSDWLYPPPPDPDPFPWRAVIVIVLLAAKCTQFIIADNSRMAAERRAVEQAAQQEKMSEMFKDINVGQFVKMAEDSAAVETTNKEKK